MVKNKIWEYFNKILSMFYIELKLKGKEIKKG